VQVLRTFLGSPCTSIARLQLEFNCEEGQTLRRKTKHKRKHKEKKVPKNSKTQYSGKIKKTRNPVRAPMGKPKRALISKPNSTQAIGVGNDRWFVTLLIQSRTEIEEFV